MLNNYTEIEIKLIQDFISGRSVLIGKSIQWVDKHLKFEDRNKVLLTLKNSLNTLKKVENNIGKKPVIAVYGASQVGKSYLIKNLLSEEGKPFHIENAGVYFDFLKEINPPGTGAESTGLVTRFTIDQDVTYPDFPIKVNLLAPKDILLVLLDSFFLDLKKITAFPSKSEFESHIKKLELEIPDGNQNHLTEYDILEIKEYFERNLSQYTILFEGLYESRFFERIGKIISHYSYDDWSHIFNILWNKEILFTELFISLVRKLHTLNFTRHGYVKFENVLRDKGAILDVKRLGELELDTFDNLTTFKTIEGSEVNIPIPALTALISELVFSIPKDLVKSKEFLNFNDLLDFPGARSRLALDQKDISPKNIDGMLLRGKVSYLFNKYSADFDINNLLFCTNDKQSDVNEIPTLLNNWIQNNIGETAEEREQSLQGSDIPPLFVIFTFFNNQMKFDTTNDYEYLESADKLNYKWNTRFERFFEQEIVTKSRNWNTKWTLKDKLFKNFYLLRDFKYSNDSFVGFEKEGVETEVNLERANFLKVLKESFVNHSFVQKHFSESEKVWDNVAAKNHDGSKPIIDALIKVSTNRTKINHNLQKLNAILKNVQDELEHYIHKDDVVALREQQMRHVNQFQLSFNNALVKDIGLFNSLIDRISLHSQIVYHLLNENMVVDASKKVMDETTNVSIMLEQYPELKDASSKDEALDILKRYLWLPSHSEVEDFLKSNGVSINKLLTQEDSHSSKAAHYVQLVLNNWAIKINDLDQYSDLIALGLSKSNLTFVLSYLQELTQKRKIEEKLVKVLNNIVSEIDINHGHESFLAETFSLIINEMVINFDINYFTDEEKAEARSILATNANRFYERKLDTSDAAISALFDNEQIDVRAISLQKYNKWIEFLRISLLVNAGYVNYDEQANRELQNLLHEYSPFQLN
ncbi:virulence factor SrfC family protein [Pedobacter immunditicola]|uniref:virulence factor SrfC family protein n=1 Tax=Pedobacter immunditicola TaxID=3133440 RepID=UPI0030989DCF